MTTVLPTAQTIEPLAAGITWDAVRVPRHLAAEVMKYLGDACGAVVDDGHVAYWFVRPHTAQACEVYPEVSVLSIACWVAVPPVSRISGPGVRWAVAPLSGRTFTDPGMLAAALSHALATEAGAQ